MGVSLGIPRRALQFMSFEKGVPRDVHFGGFWLGDGFGEDLGGEVDKKVNKSRGLGDGAPGRPGTDF